MYTICHSWCYTQVQRCCCLCLRLKDEERKIPLPSNIKHLSIPWVYTISRCRQFLTVLWCSHWQSSMYKISAGKLWLTLLPTSLLLISFPTSPMCIIVAQNYNHEHSIWQTLMMYMYLQRLLVLSSGTKTLYILVSTDNPPAFIIWYFSMLIEMTV